MYVKSETMHWNLPDSLLILVIGHIHIGAINVTLWDTTDDKKNLIAVSKPSYDENNFIIRMTRSTPYYQLRTGHNYTLDAVYDNSQAYAGVMGLMQTFVSPLQKV